jgi:hypothetical protein
MKFPEIIQYWMLRRTFAPMTNDVTGDWQKLRNEELRYLYSSPHIIRMIGSRRIRWTEYVEHMGHEKCVKICVGNSEWKRPLGKYECSRGKAVPLPPCRRQGWEEYSSYSFLTSALDEGEWSASRPGRTLPSGKDPRCPLVRRLGGPQRWLDTEARGKHLLPLPEI